jgi:hypothetical protein
MLSFKCLQQIFARRGYHAIEVNLFVKLQEYVGGWLDAPDDVWDEPQPHTEASYSAYLRWYLACVRTSVFHVLMTRSISTSRPSRTHIACTVIRHSVARYVFRNFNY